MIIFNKPETKIPVIYNFKTGCIFREADNETKKVDKSSLEALSSIGRAQVNMSFKGKLDFQRSYSSPTEMSDEEFEAHKKEIAEKLSKLPKKIQKKFQNIKFSKINIALADKIVTDNRLYNNTYSPSILNHTYTEKQANLKATLIDKILSDERLYNNENVMNHLYIVDFCDTYCTDSKFKILNKVLSDEKIYNDEYCMHNLNWLCFIMNEEQIQLADKIISNEQLYSNKKFFGNINSIFPNVKTKAKAEEKIQIIDKILSDERLYNNKYIMDSLIRIINHINSKIMSKAIDNILNKLISDERLYNNKELMNLSANIILAINKKEEADYTLEFLDALKIVPEQIVLIYDNENKISLEKIQQISKLNKTIGIENASKLDFFETETAIDFVSEYDITDINEISMSDKREFLHNIVNRNTILFFISDEMKQMFPLLPTTKEEYCSLLPSIIHSLGIETNSLDEKQIDNFNRNINKLGISLSELSDEEFNNLEITQEYPKDEFIRDVFDIVKDLNASERQKVYNYFGFELNRNTNANTKININRKKIGFSIVGYPANLNNGEKLAQITDPKTKKVVENLRNYVVKFSESNKIICNNPEITEELNNIIEVLPEIRTEIDNIQEGMNGTRGQHKFDIMKHSLKVMQKIVQNPEFNKLKESDKKIMLIASLLHDIAKKEGSTDETHAEYSAFDTFFISKKFNLTDDEQLKLHNLVKHHEWQDFLKKSKYEEDYIKRLQSTAYDLRHDNILEMLRIFTHADLKAVKMNDSFYNKRDYRIGRPFLEGRRSFGENTDYYAQKIQELIEELSISQPLLPVTEFPKASTIDKAITTVNDDGSTNIKGIYKDKNGLIVIKYNEVEDWDGIGFPEGSISKGIKLITEKGEKVDTGNIKFFAHGLDSSDSLINFDAFSFVDSDALLSVSYAERPESKYRFFRPQGVILNCDTKYVHGGGNTDSGSGVHKSIQEFKDNYIFGGIREEDRLYISNLIKEATGMSDNEYIEFVKNNENKPFNEIEPAEQREKIIKAFSGINSNKRTGMRQYNEMYISNPKPPMAVFAYNMNNYEKIGNPIEFLSRTSIDKYEIDKSVFERTEFLQKYALERDIPFVIFGD